MEDIPDLEGRLKIHSNENSMTITKATEDDSGSYTCRLNGSPQSKPFYVICE